MKKTTLKLLGTSVLLLATALPTSAADFYRTGAVLRVLTDADLYGGCMVLLDTSISNGCPANGWVSLDCDNTYHSDAESKRNYAMVLTALASNKTMSVKIDNTKTHNGYCVAERLDIIK